MIESDQSVEGGLICESVPCEVEETCVRAGVVSSYTCANDHSRHWLSTYISFVGRCTLLVSVTQQSHFVSAYHGSVPVVPPHLPLNSSVVTTRSDDRAADDHD